jgi:hypothetical protein
MQTNKCNNNVFKKTVIFLKSLINLSRGPVQSGTENAERRQNYINALFAYTYTCSGNLDMN